MSNDPVDGGTVTYHRAEYDPIAVPSGPWLVWFTDDGPPRRFTAAEGEAMGLTPPEPAPLPAPLVVELTADGEGGDLYIEQLRDPNAVDVDPSEPAPFATWHPTLVASIKGAMSGYVSEHEQAISAALGVVEQWLLRDARQDPQPASDEPGQVDTASGIDFDALPIGTVLRYNDDGGIRAKVGENQWLFGSTDSVVPDGWMADFDEYEVLHQPAPLSPGECLRGLLAGRDDADELLRHAVNETPNPRLMRALGAAAREVHGG